MILFISSFLQLFSFLHLYPANLIHELIYFIVGMFDFFLDLCPFICLLVSNFVKAFVEGEHFVDKFDKGLLFGFWDDFDRNFLALAISIF